MQSRFRLILGLPSTGRRPTCTCNLRDLRNVHFDKIRIGKYGRTKSKIKNEEPEIRNILERYIYLYNSENPNEKINPDNLFINDCVNKPGAIGCYGKNKPISVVQSFSRLASVVCLYTSPHTQLSTAKCPERFSLRALLRPMFCVHFVHNVKS